ncbi:MAG TPA: hypothetical protein DCM40_14720, partial [Maribacter sp.]|nr:hypothetical protein [Maribacter sp.]
DVLSSMPKEKKDFLNNWFTRPGGKNNETPEVNEADKVDIGKDKENSYAYTSGVVNREALVEAIQKAKEGTDLESISISDMTKTFRFGVRIVYVPPSGDEVSFKGASQSYTGATMSDFVPIYNEDNILNYELQLNEATANADELLNSGDTGFDPVYTKKIKSPNGDQAKEDAITLISNKEKLFRIREKMGTFTEDFEQLGVPFDGDVFEFVGGNLSQNITVRTLYPIELVSVEDDYGFLDVLKQEDGRVNLDDLMGALSDGVATGAIFNALKEKLINDEKYKFVFHYDIPVRRALSLLFIQQNFSSVRNYPPVTRSYSITKNMIRSSFFNMIPGDPWWSKQDKRIEEQGGNAGMMETA